jgi:cyclic-di-GMP-binding protein
VFSPVLSVPAHRVSAWVAETDPKYASAWLAALPLVNSTESGREIYQALYTINRLELRLQDRLELMAMYDQAVATVCQGMQPHLLLEGPPLGPKKRQLAEFIRRLHVEMAFGYKCCLRDLSRARLSLGRKRRAAACIERALHHLGEVLLRSYVVYLPYPASAWREIHELYRLAESLKVADGPLDVGMGNGVQGITINERYAQTVLLGLINPYQLPQGAVQQVNAFLSRWAAQATVTPQTGPINVIGCFMIDLEADAPPVPLAKGGQRLERNTRVLDTHVLLQTIQKFVVQLERGESIEKSGLGVDCLDSACMELLRRMIRAWGESATRRHARRQQTSAVFVCVGLNAAHYYVNGQRSVATYAQSFASSQSAPPRTNVDDVAFVELDEIQEQEASVSSVAAPASLPISETHQVNRWRLRDIGPQGMSLTRYADAMAPIRVGELIGVQQPNDFGRWRVAVIRWVKTPEANSVEVGIETLAKSVTPALVRRSDKTNADANLSPALLLPAVDIIKGPPKLVLPRGACVVGDAVELMDEESEPRQIRISRLLERTGSFEQVEYREIAVPTRRRP